MVDKLNKRELAFVYWRARGCSLVESVLKAGYKAGTRKLASIYGTELEKKTKISQAVEIERTNIFDAATITTDFVLEGLKKIALAGQVEANKVRAWELLGKYLAMFIDKTQEVPIEKEDNQFSLERLSRIKQADSQ